MQGAVVATEECTDGDTTRASVTPIGVRCRQVGCAREPSVPGTIVRGGFAVAPGAGARCPACRHAWQDHEPLGVTKGPVDTGEPST